MLNRDVAGTSGEAVTLVTFGTSLTNQNGWQGDLAADLGRAWGRTVRVDKVALGGKTSRWGLENVARVVALAPRIVLIEFLINDADVRHRLWPGESRSNHVAIIDRLRRDLPGVSLYLMTMSPARGIRRWVLRPFLGTYNAQYRALSEATGVGFIDITPSWSEPGLDLKAAIPDGVHPTRAAVLRITVPAIVRGLTPP